MNLQIEGLRRAGVTVELFTASSDDIGKGLRAKVGVAQACLGTDATRVGFVETLERFRPDVVHLENLYPMISPLPGQVARERGIPVVASVRNFRMTCAAGTHVREGLPCTSCVDNAGLRNLPAVWHGCYRGSKLASAAIGGSMGRFAGLMRNLDHYLPISDFMARYLTDIGKVNAGRITVRANAGTLPAATFTPITSRTALFAGRLVGEKGPRELARAWTEQRPAGWTLQIAGDGPLRAEIEAIALRERSITLLGSLSQAEVADAVTGAALVIVPSLWDEPFGRAVVDAYEHGRPVMACASGGLGELVSPQTGHLVPATLDGLAQGLRFVSQLTSAQLDAMGIAAAARYNAMYTPERNIETLLSVYEKVRR